jgi:hypothetical protein
MTPRLTTGGYARTKAKLENLERRLADLESRAKASFGNNLLVFISWPNHARLLGVSPYSPEMGGGT